jgi:hypothetical protein
VGQEKEAKLRIDGGEAIAGKALLETDEIIFRGARRVVIPFASIKKIEVKRGHLVLASAAGVADLELGAAAKTWAEKIANPKGRLDKLGVKPGAEVVLVGSFDDALGPELDARGCSVKTRARAGDARALVLFSAEKKGDLARVPALRESLADNGALWIVYPKGKTEIREADVRAAGRGAKMTDHKVARFSETHTGLKFVIPPALRKT